MTTPVPHRLRAADLLDIIERLTTRTATEPTASVEIARNAAGNAQVSVKVFASASSDETAVKLATERAFDQATDAYDALCTQYPHVPPVKKEPAK